jgi:hypothetical protein
MTSSLLQKMDDRLDRAMDFESIVDLHEALTMIVKDNTCLTKMAEPPPLITKNDLYETHSRHREHQRSDPES